MTRTVLIITFLVIFLILTVFVLCQNYEHYVNYAKCTLESGEDGMCRPLLDCTHTHNTAAMDNTAPGICTDDYVCCGLNVSHQIDIKVLSDKNSSSTDFTEVNSRSCLKNLNLKLNEDAPGLPYKPSEDKEFHIESLNYSFMAKIGNRDLNGDVRYFCGGVLISSGFILTPAHCVTSQRTADVVWLGSVPTENSKSDDIFEKIPITKIHIHPDYNNAAMYNDLAILELGVDSKFMPICVKPKREDALTESSIFAIGHNLANGSNYQFTLLNFMPCEECTQIYANVPSLPHGIRNSQFCLTNSSVLNSKMCKGFIGGPLIARLPQPTNEVFLIGLANYVQQCQSAVYPMIYTNISAHWLWLRKIIETDLALS